MTKTTKTVAGRKLTLVSGVTYLASRPWAVRGRTSYPVTIEPTTWKVGEVVEGVTLTGLTYDEANRFLKAFNNGATSFDGRIW